MNCSQEPSGPGQALCLANFLSPCLDDFCTALAADLGAALGAPVHFNEGAAVEAIGRGEVDMAFLCGLPYTRIVDRAGPVLVPVAAALVDDARVAEQPVYFSEVVVAAGSVFRDLASLRGASFGYNEAASFSGFVNLGAALTERGLDWRFFERCLRSGSHADSLRMVAGGETDSAAIDSHALQMEIARDPALQAGLRVVDSVGPFPMPPFVVSRRLDAGRRDAVARVLLAAHEAQGPIGESLRQCSIVRFAGVADDFYDPIRRAARIAPPLTSSG